MSRRKGQGQAIIRRPRIETVVDEFLLDGKTAGEISKILQNDFDFKVSEGTIRNYIKNYSQKLTPEAQMQLSTIFKALIASKKETVNKYIEGHETFLETMISAYEQLNKEAWLMSTSQKISPSAQGAIALIGIVKLMLDIRERTEELKQSTGVSTRELVNKVLMKVTDVFVNQVLEHVPEENKSKVKKIIRKEFDALENELCEVIVPYKIT